MSAGLSPLVLAWGLARAETPADPAALAAALGSVERGCRDPAVDDARAAELGHEQQRLVRALALDPALEARVSALLAADLIPAVQSEVAATRHIRSTVGGRRSNLPAWTIVEAPPPAELRAQYDRAQAELDVPWELLAAIHLVETRMGRLRGVSGAGARGPMQFIPATWARFGQGDIEDSQDSILAAARHLRHYGAGADLDTPGLDAALWHYNPSDDYVAAVRTYASLMREEPSLYRCYWGWQVYYSTSRGPVLLPVGYAAQEPVPLTTWCAVGGRCPG